MLALVKDSKQATGAQQAPAAAFSVGAMLVSGRRPRSTSPAEERYGQVELESLAQQWGINQNRYYLLGKKFKSWTDHLPLLTHYNNRMKVAPARIDRHRQKIQEFEFDMGHIP